MTTTASATATPPGYDNNGQYSRTGILRYESIFGAGYVSTGGHETTESLCSRLGDALRPGVRVLDVGSGIGGAAFHLARVHGAEVTGIDLSPEMVAIAQQRQQEAEVPPAVSFILGDILETPLEGGFDVIWSRDALMHVLDKPRLFRRLHELLRPGGRLAITDYARGTSGGSPEFLAYIEQTGYHLTDPASYGALLEAAGFTDVVVEDATSRFIEILERESERLAARRAEFLAAFGEEDLNYLLARWAMKVRFCQAGDMKWGIYQATRAR
ncbi:MAG TPA: methyltransferase domain-containing protein [Isosphaeraceae bacterium]|jgi:phosphoethanolamine N-methyltransferase